MLQLTAEINSYHTTYFIGNVSMISLYIYYNQTNSNDYIKFATDL